MKSKTIAIVAMLAISTMAVTFAAAGPFATVRDLYGDTVACTDPDGGEEINATICGDLEFLDEQYNATVCTDNALLHPTVPNCGNAYGWNSTIQVNLTDNPLVPYDRIFISTTYGVTPGIFLGNATGGAISIQDFAIDTAIDTRNGIICGNADVVEECPDSYRTQLNLTGDGDVAHNESNNQVDIAGNQVLFEGGTLFVNGEPVLETDMDALQFSSSGYSIDVDTCPAWGNGTATNCGEQGTDNSINETTDYDGDGTKLRIPTWILITGLPLPTDTATDMVFADNPEPLEQVHIKWPALAPVDNTYYAPQPIYSQYSNLDGDDYNDADELLCDGTPSNPLNPLSDCDDYDGDGWSNMAEDKRTDLDKFAPNSEQYFLTFVANRTELTAFVGETQSVRFTYTCLVNYRHSISQIEAGNFGSDIFATTPATNFTEASPTCDDSPQTFVKTFAGGTYFQDDGNIVLNATHAAQDGATMYDLTKSVPLKWNVTAPAVTVNAFDITNESAGSQSEGFTPAVTYQCSLSSTAGVQSYGVINFTYDVGLGDHASESILLPATCDGDSHDVEAPHGFNNTGSSVRNVQLSMQVNTTYTDNATLDLTGLNHKFSIVGKGVSVTVFQINNDTDGGTDSPGFLPNVTYACDADGWTVGSTAFINFTYSTALGDDVDGVQQVPATCDGATYTLEAPYGFNNTDAAVRNLALDLEVETVDVGPLTVALPSNLDSTFKIAKFAADAGTLTCAVTGFDNGTVHYFVTAKACDDGAAAADFDDVEPGATTSYIVNWSFEQLSTSTQSITEVAIADAAGGFAMVNASGTGGFWNFTTKSFALDNGTIADVDFTVKVNVGSIVVGPMDVGSLALALPKDTLLNVAPVLVEQHAPVATESGVGAYDVIFKVNVTDTANTGDAYDSTENTAAPAVRLWYRAEGASGWADHWDLVVLGNCPTPDPGEAAPDEAGGGYIPLTDSINQAMQDDGEPCAASGTNGNFADGEEYGIIETLSVGAYEYYYDANDTTILVDSTSDGSDSYDPENPFYVFVVGDLNLADPVELLTNPACDGLGPNAPEDPTSGLFTRDADCGSILSYFADTTRLLDNTDYSDHDENGVTEEPNGQIDLVERYVLFIDEDNSDTTNDKFDGVGGTTYYIRDVDEENIFGRPSNLAVVRDGDVSGTSIQEILVIETNGQVICVYEQPDGASSVGTGLYLATSAGSFRDDDSTPCGTDNNVTSSVNIVNDGSSVIVWQDANGDGERGGNEDVFGATLDAGTNFVNLTLNNGGEISSYRAELDASNPAQSSLSTCEDGVCETHVLYDEINGAFEPQSVGGVATITLNDDDENAVAESAQVEINQTYPSPTTCAPPSGPALPACDDATLFVNETIPLVGGDPTTILADEDGNGSPDAIDDATGDVGGDCDPTTLECEPPVSPPTGPCGTSGDVVDGMLKVCTTPGQGGFLTGKLDLDGIRVVLPGGITLNL